MKPCESHVKVSDNGDNKVYVSNWIEMLTPAMSTSILQGVTCQME